MRPVRRIGVLLHPSRDTAGVVEELCRWSEHPGRAICSIDKATSSLPAGPASECDVLLAAGGDGTGDTITLTGTHQVGQLVRLDGHSFYHRARRKLQLTDPPQLRRTS